MVQRLAAAQRSDVIEGLRSGFHDPQNRGRIGRRGSPVGEPADAALAPLAALGNVGSGACKIGYQRPRGIGELNLADRTHRAPPHQLGFGGRRLALGDRRKLNSGRIKQGTQPFDLFLGRSASAKVGRRRGASIEARTLAKASFELLESFGQVAAGQRDFEAHASPA